MSSTHGRCSLYLAPEQPDFNVDDLSSLVETLQDIGLISHKIRPQDNDTRYYSGERFLDHIAYMGCAPAIQFEADDDDEDFCSIRLHQYEKAKLIYSRTQSRAPHCPACKKPVREWQDNKTDSSINCNLCHTTSAIEKFDWRRMAGVARLFIEITDIFPKEAIPQQLLMDKLASICRTGWLYFYSCE